MWGRPHGRPFFRWYRDVGYDDLHVGVQGDGILVTVSG